MSTTASRLALKRSLAAVGLASTLLLTGCGSAPAEESFASSQGAEQAVPAAPAETAPGAAESTEAPAAPAETAPETAKPADEWFDVAYEDSYKSVFLLSAAQIKDATGLDVATASASDLSTAFADAELWAGDSRSADYADVIVTAFKNESDRLNGTVNALRNDDGARLKVFVKHDSHKTIAHVQTSHEGDQHHG
ncbi:hypothetical protein ICL81_07485 [Leucobacter sp. cx-328]|uniref:hypothetical protein n=1 Tax=unclassified Leucobacter TaxID=2621730 RepID=UPI00165E50F5|nr:MULTISPECIES: hypothetical protein [unclassified Leucobacter]MBC9944351.1 hypothetical protein [Leucobacter sp. cx-328]